MLGKKGRKPLGGVRVFGFLAKKTNQKDQQMLERLQSLRATGAYEELIQICDKALEVNPKSGPVTYERATYLVEMKRLPEAAEWFAKAGQLGGPGTEDAFEMQVRVLRRANDIPGAIKGIKEALKCPHLTIGASCELRLIQAKLHMLQGEGLKALELLTSLRSELGTQTPAIHSLHRVEAMLLIEGKFEEADKLLKTTLRMPDTDFLGIANWMQKLVTLGARGKNRTLVEQATALKEGKLEWESVAYSNDPVVAHVTAHLGTPASSVSAGEMRLLVVEPGTDSPYKRVVTLGMSAKPMKAGVHEQHWSELMVTLDPAAEPEWAMKLLQELAEYPHREGKVLLSGHVLPNPGLNCDYAGFLVLPSITAPKAFQNLKVQQRNIAFLSIYPLYKEEVELKAKSGVAALFPLFEQHGVSDKILPTRVNTAIS